AFAVASNIQKKSNKKVSVVFEVVDTAPTEKTIIEGIEYQISLRHKGVDQQYLSEYIEILNILKRLTNVNYSLRKQAEFNGQPIIEEILNKIGKNHIELGKIMDPTNGKLRIRVACPKCGLADKQGIKTVIKSNSIVSYCPEHGNYETAYKDNFKFEFNTPLRNLIRAMAYSLDNTNSNLPYEWVRVTGADYAGFYQEQILYKPASFLGFETINLPIILYSPLITDWSGAKLSKSLYVKEGAYKYLPQYLVNYEAFKSQFGVPGFEKLFNEIDLWVREPYRLFRNYSVYYFINLFENGNDSNI
ncbi:MAG: hypothetical protein KBD25_06415, partial [Rickettsiaceae bacterium]|nr:hypothetical protein [Rickettsiaceae bacterium]